MRFNLSRVLAGVIGLGVAAGGVLGTASGQSTGGKTDPSGDEYYSVVREAARGLDDFTVYRPADLDRFRSRSLPLVVWGNGGCDRSNLVVEGYLNQVAAEGYVIVADGGLGTPPDVSDSGPDVLVGAIDWALTSQQARTQLRGRLDTSKVATMGRSCGGLQALRAGLDPRVDSVVSLHSGYFPQPRLGYDIAELQRLEAPVLFGNGGPTDVAYANSRNNYELAPVPAALVEFATGGHHGITSGHSDGEIESEYLYLGVQTAVNWLDYTLNGDDEARQFFTGPDCGLCGVDNWSVQTKGIS